MQQQQQGPSGFRRHLNTGLVIAKCGSCVWTPLTRQQHGLRFPGMYGFLCWLGMIVAGCFSADPGPVMGFIACWSCTVLIRRAQARLLAWNGVYEHSLYDGFPGLVLDLFPWLGSEAKARNVEPILCGCVAYGVAGVFTSLGHVLMIGAVSLAAVRVLDARNNSLEVMQLRDQQILMRQTLERFRDGNGY
jgi:hypothetical protein